MLILVGVDRSSAPDGDEALLRTSPPRDCFSRRRPDPAARHRRCPFPLFYPTPSCEPPQARFRASHASPLPPVGAAPRPRAPVRSLSSSSLPGLEPPHTASRRWLAHSLSEENSAEARHRQRPWRPAPPRVCSCCSSGRPTVCRRQAPVPLLLHRVYWSLMEAMATGAAASVCSTVSFFFYFISFKIFSWRVPPIRRERESIFSFVFFSGGPRRSKPPLTIATSAPRRGKPPRD